MDPYLAKKEDFPRISDGFSEISVGSKGLIHGMSPSSLQSSTLVPIPKDKRKSLSV